jgi:cell division protein FtsW (lipid II flippase)
MDSFGFNSSKHMDVPTRKATGVSVVASLLMSVFAIGIVAVSTTSMDTHLTMQSSDKTMIAFGRMTLFSMSRSTLLRDNSPSMYITWQTILVVVVVVVVVKQHLGNSRTVHGIMDQPCKTMVTPVIDMG